MWWLIFFLSSQIDLFYEIYCVYHKGVNKYKNGQFLTENFPLKNACEFRNMSMLPRSVHFTTKVPDV